MQIQQQAEKFFCYCLKVGQISFPKRYNFLSKKAWFKSYEHFAKPRIFPKITARTGADLARAKRSQRVNEERVHKEKALTFFEKDQMN